MFVWPIPLLFGVGLGVAPAWLVGAGVGLVVVIGVGAADVVGAGVEVAFAGLSAKRSQAT